jgi:hypothetical protein
MAFKFDVRLGTYYLTRETRGWFGYLTTLSVYSARHTKMSTERSSSSCWETVAENCVSLFPRQVGTPRLIWMEDVENDLPGLKMNRSEQKAKERGE